MALARDEECKDGILQEIGKSRHRILLSLVENEFRSEVGENFGQMMRTCDEVSKARVSRDRFAKIMRERCPNIPDGNGKFLATLFEMAKVPYDEAMTKVELMNTVMEYMIFKPVKSHETLKEKWIFKTRDDNWREKQHWLAHRLGTRLFSSLGSDASILSQALTVKDADYKDKRVTMITTDEKWRRVRSKLGTPKSYRIVVFRRKEKTTGDAECVRDS